MTYDRGSKIVGMIEERLGEAAFLDFMRHVYGKYQFRILRVADFQRELEAYTGQSWEEFFQHWLYGTGVCDWAVEKRRDRRPQPAAAASAAIASRTRRSREAVSSRLAQAEAAVQRADVAGLRLAGRRGLPDPHADPSRSCRSWQIDRARRPTSRRCPSTDGQRQPRPRRGHAALASRRRSPSIPTTCCSTATRRTTTGSRESAGDSTPLYTQLEETDVTNAYDRWNLICRAVAVRLVLQRSVVHALADGRRARRRPTGRSTSTAAPTSPTAPTTATSSPAPTRSGITSRCRNTQVGFNVERSAGHARRRTTYRCSRGVLFGRYILTYGSRLYLPPFEYVEAFGTVQNRCLPIPRSDRPARDLFDDRTGPGPALPQELPDAVLGPRGRRSRSTRPTRAACRSSAPTDGFHQLDGQVVHGEVHAGPRSRLLGDHAVPGLAEGHAAGRFACDGAAALPDNGQFFTLGGGDHFRGFDLAERQGSSSGSAASNGGCPWSRTCLGLAAITSSASATSTRALFYDVGDVVRERPLARAGRPCRRRRPARRRRLARPHRTHHAALRRGPDRQRQHAGAILVWDAASVLTHS